ncbi:hypothetical protein DDZ18_01755 [Marinicauda salina]|uniref:GP-PDE domain-containing protein n=1 Tax=Marinicauda salina TaxID=2135793 RepID=A0A2U2BWF9_9PROT|nr:glycerophosphodiester phosphodiesterase family protein [Marinicauda salina]PWE18356.1 hypothetical protein DDZ18_01755 [Marinicauda salina]
MSIPGARSVIVCGLVAALGACSPGESGAPADPPRAQPWLDGVDLAAFLDCAREQGATLVSAHRAGPRPGYAENAISTMLASARDGAVFVEIDVARTADGRLVLMHDDTLARTTTGEGRVAETDWSRIRTLLLTDETGAALEESPPLLADALAALDGVAIAQLDPKTDRIAEIVAAVIDAQAVDRVLVIAYSLDDAIALHRAAPELMLSVGLDSMRELERLQRAGVDLSRIVAWLGADGGDAVLDAALAERGVETSYADFGAERDGTINYRALSAAGGEILSIDGVEAAAGRLDARENARRVLAACPAAQPSAG